MYREISDLGLFVQTSPHGLGLYKKDLGVQTSRSVNEKLILTNIVITIVILERQ
jgi:hypothetical protein